MTQSQPLPTQTQSTDLVISNKEIIKTVEEQMPDFVKACQTIKKNGTVLFAYHEKDFSKTDINQTELGEMGLAIAYASLMDVPIIFLPKSKLGKAKNEMELIQHLKTTDPYGRILRFFQV